MEKPYVNFLKVSTKTYSCRLMRHNLNIGFSHITLETGRSLTLSLTLREISTEKWRRLSLKYLLVKLVETKEVQLKILYTPLSTGPPR